MAPSVPRVHVRVSDWGGWIRRHLPLHGDEQGLGGGGQEGGQGPGLGREEVQAERGCQD